MRSKNRITNVARNIILGFILVIFTCQFCFANNQQTYADELSDAKSNLNEQVTKLDELTTKISEMQASIDEKADAATQLEKDIADNQDKLGEMAVFFYKNPSASIIDFMLRSENLTQMLARAEVLYDYTDEIVRITRTEREQREQLQLDIAQISLEKDEQMASVEELKTIVSELKSKVGELEREQADKLYATGETFETDLSGDGWHTGKASAYGDGGDSHTTAMGTSIDNTPAIAVPMSWPNYRSYFGKKVEISYNGKSVIGIISDCGGFGPYGRDLDISYTVIRAWGFYTTDDWGVRTVKWRIL